MIKRCCKLRGIITNYKEDLMMTVLGILGTVHNEKMRQEYNYSLKNGGTYRRV